MNDEKYFFFTYRLINQLVPLVKVLPTEIYISCAYCPRRVKHSLQLLHMLKRKQLRFHTGMAVRKQDKVYAIQDFS